MESSLSSNQNLCPNSIVDYCPIRIPTTNPNWRSRFCYKIDLFKIYFWLKDWIISTKCRLFNQKRWLINRKLWFISKTMIYIENNDVFDVIRPIFDLNRPIFDINWIRIQNPNPRKRQLKLIRIQFKTNLNWRSISLMWFYLWAKSINITKN